MRKSSIQALLCRGLVLFLVPAAVSCTKGIIEQDAVIAPTGESGVDTLPAGDEPGREKAGNASEGSELGTIYFAFDSYTLQPKAVSALKSNTAWLKQQPDTNVQIEGHCDERGTIEYNLALGERRAVAVRNFLIQQGIEAARVSVISYGKERPADPGHGERAWARNRRAVTVILPNDRAR
jgi:peptidoglycan-associated lipoprotein